MDNEIYCIGYKVKEIGIDVPSHKYISKSESLYSICDGCAREIGHFEALGHLVNLNDIVLELEMEIRNAEGEVNDR